MIKSIVTSLILSFTLVGCVHLGSVSTSSIPADRSRPVEVERFQFLPFLMAHHRIFKGRLSKFRIGNKRHRVSWNFLDAIGLNANSFP